jgi:glycosyltransferase involved in cell wall biosynthesis
MHIRAVKKENLSYEVICEKYGLDKEKEHYSYVARLTEQKNPIRYLELVKEMMKDNSNQMQFIMVGDGVYKEKVDDYILNNNLENQLIRIPYVANTPELIGALDGLVITSNYEGLPIVSIEAMCMGTPIFSTDTGDTKRFVEKNQCGKIIDDTMSDVDNFLKFHEKLSMYKENAIRCAEGMLEFFSVNNISKQYYETFNKAKADMESQLENAREE